MKTFIKILLCSIIVITLSGCAIYAVIDTNSAMIVESKISADRYRVRYNNNQYFMEIVTADSLVVDDPNPQIMSSDAIKLGLRERTFDERDNGWVAYEIPKEVILSTRMHLTRKQVAKMLPFLQKFAETGSLE